MAFDPSGRSYAFCEYQVRTLCVAMSASEDHGPDSDWQVHVVNVYSGGLMVKMRRHTVAWNALFGLGAQPLVWDAKSQYTCKPLAALVPENKAHCIRHYA